MLWICLGLVEGACRADVLLVIAGTVCIVPILIILVTMRIVKQWKNDIFPEE